MGLRIVKLCLSAALAFLAAFLLVKACGMPGGRYGRRGRRAGVTRALERLATGGVRPLLPLAAAVLRIGAVHRFADEAVHAVSAWAPAAESAALMSALLCAVMGLALAAGAVTGSLLGGLAAAACAVGGLVAFVKSRVEKRNAAVRAEVPSVLRAMESCFGVGFSLAQTLNHLAYETKGPLCSVFQRSVHILDTGGTVPQALEAFRAEAQVPELAFVAVALDVQHATGGSMGAVLSAARETVHDELQLVQTLKVQTAQARLSARIVSLMPLALVLVFSLVSQNFFAPFFESALGLALLLVAVALQVIGVLLVRRMLRMGAA